MSFQLKPDEALEALQAVNPDLAQQFEAILCGATTAMAQALATYHGCQAGVATMQGVAFAGITVPMLPGYNGQALPADWSQYDSEEEWRASWADAPEGGWGDPDKVEG